MLTHPPQKLLCHHPVFRPRVAFDAVDNSLVADDVLVLTNSVFLWISSSGNGLRLAYLRLLKTLWEVFVFDRVDDLITRMHVVQVDQYQFRVQEHA